MTEKEKVKVGTANDQDAGAAVGGAHTTRRSNRNQIIISKSVNQIGILSSNNGDHSRDVEDYPIIENAIVEVLPRTWPGSNKEGGVAQVVKCYFTTSEVEGVSNGQSLETSQNQRLSHVDVKYMARRGREKMVPIEYCQAAPHFDDSYRRQKASKEVALNGTNSNQGIGRTLRDRSAMKGRCSNCGSLRSDCNSCDWREETRLISFTSKRSQRKSKESDSDSGGDSEGDSEGDSSYNSSGYKALSLRERRQQNILSSSEESDVGDSDNEVLANLKQNSPKYTTQSFLQKRRKYRKPRYSQSNPKFEERMRFLDDLLKKKSEVPSKKTRNMNYQKSVLEDLALLRSQSENEVNSQHSKRRNLDKDSTELVQSDKRRKRINTSLSSFSEQMDVEVEEENELVDDNGVSKPCESPISESRVVAKFVDGADIGENEVEEDEDEDELTNLNKTPTKIYTVSHEIGDRRDEIQGYYEESPSRNTFIQPEGKEAAENLPSDMADKTKGIAFCNLPNFFEEIAEKLLSILIPQYDKRITNYENKVMSITSERDDTSIDLAVRTERDCLALSKEMKIVLVRDGIDQCTRALGRYEEKRLFRQHRGELSRRLWEERVENLGFRLDVINQKVENMLKRVSSIASDCYIYQDCANMNDNDGNSVDEINSDNNDDFSDSIESSVPAKIGYMNEEMNDSYENNTGSNHSTYVEDDLDPNLHVTAVRRSDKKRSKSFPNEAGTEVDPHPYASRIRSSKNRNRLNTSSENRSNRMSNRKYTRQQRDKVTRNTESGRNFENGDQTNSIINRQGESYGVRSKNKQSKQKRKYLSDLGLEESSRRRRRRNDQNYQKGFSVSRRKKNRKTVGVSSANDSRHTNDVSTSRHRQPSLRDIPNDAEIAHDFTSHGDIALESEHEDVWNEDVWTTLIERTQNSVEQEDTSMPNASGDDIISLFRLCDQLCDEYPNSMAKEIMDSIICIFDKVIPPESQHTASLQVHTAILNSLRKTKFNCLQEMIAMKYEHTSICLCLLRFIFSLKKRKIHSHLKVADGVIFNVFCKDDFPNLICLQMIDVMYAHWFPEAWGQPRKMSRVENKEICSLRDEFGKTSHLLETYSTMMVKYPCQKWLPSTLKSASNKSWYVSSIEQGSMDTVLRGEGFKVCPSSESRLVLLKPKFSRREIEIIWNHMAWSSVYFTGDCKSSIRWKLLNSQFLLTAGSIGKLGGSKKSTVTFASDSQLKCCAEEIGKVRLLLKSGSMDPVPNDDSLFFKLLMGLIQLYSRNIENLDTNSSMKVDSKHACSIWLDSDLIARFNLDNSSSLLHQRMMDELHELPDERGSRFSLIPSMFLSSILLLLKEYVSRVSTKKARLTRLYSSLISLIGKVLDEAQKSTTNINEKGEKNVLSDTNINDAFAGAFSMTPVSNRLVVATESLAEASALILVSSLDEVLDFGINLDPNIPLKLSNDFVEKLWKIFGDSNLNEIHKSLMDTRKLSDKTTTGNANCNSSRIRKCMKVYCTLILTYIGVEGGALSTSESMRFSFVCIGSCVVALCNSIAEATFPAIPTDKRREIKTLSCGLFWMSSILEGISFTLSKKENAVQRTMEIIGQSFVAIALTVADRCLLVIPSSLGDQAELNMCYELTLTLIRNAVNIYNLSHKLLSSKTTHMSSPLVPEDTRATSIDDDDIFDEIDESALLSLDLDEITSKTSTVPVQNLDKSTSISMIEKIWKVLGDSLLMAKPSPQNRYRINKNISGTNVTSFNSVGRTICSSNSTRICEVLASLSIALDNRLAMIENIFLTLQSDRTASSQSCAFDEADDVFLSNLRQVLCCEICRIAQNSEIYMKSLSTHIVEGVFFRTLVYALINATTLEYYPPSNTSYQVMSCDILKSEIDNEFTKVSKKLRKVQEKEIMKTSPDVEGISVSKTNVKKSVEGRKMLSSLWVFCQNLGNMMIFSSAQAQGKGKKDLLLSIGKILASRGNDSNNPNFAEKYPKCSRERECLKRVTILQQLINIFVPSLSRDACVIKNNFLLSIVPNSLFQLQSIVKGIIYYDRNPSPETHIQKVKSELFFALYSKFMLSNIMWVYSADLVSSEKTFSSFLHKFVTQPSLGGKGISFDIQLLTSLRESSKGQSQIIFENGCPSPISSSPSVVKDLLFAGITQHFRELIFYCENDANLHANFHDVLNHCSNASPSLLRQVFFLPQILPCSRKANDFHRNNLSFEETILEICKERLKYSESLDTLRKFQHFMMEKFLPRMIQLKTAGTKEKRLSALHILRQIITKKETNIRFQMPNDTLRVAVENITRECDFLAFTSVDSIIIAIATCIDQMIISGKLDTSTISLCYMDLHSILLLHTDTAENRTVLDYIKNNKIGSLSLHCIEIMQLLTYCFLNLPQEPTLLKSYRDMEFVDHQCAYQPQISRINELLSLVDKERVQDINTENVYSANPVATNNFDYGSIQFETSEELIYTLTKFQQLSVVNQETSN